MKNLFLGFAAALVVGAITQSARAEEPLGKWAGEPFAGVDIGVAGPTEKFRKSADTGGMVAPFAGYRLFVLGQSLGVSLMVQPTFAGFPTAVKQGEGRQSDATTIFSATAGPRFSLLDEKLEAYFGAQGGYYTDCTGPLDDGGGGWNINGGVNYEFFKNTAIGVFVRRDQSEMQAYKIHANVPGRTEHKDLTYFSGGLSVVHRFRADEPIVAEAPPPPPPAPAPPMKKKIVLRGVNFDTDKSNIRADAQPILDEAASTLKENGDVNVSVEGHTDSRASEAYNQKLSERRADSVAEYLEKGGVAKSRLSTVGFGEAQPVATNDTAAGRQENRRVELRITNP
jgi:outer membrane protein OmpA-like peptidoglycan-associated protein